MWRWHQVVQSGTAGTAESGSGTEEDLRDRGKWDGKWDMWLNVSLQKRYATNFENLFTSQFHNWLVEKCFLSSDKLIY